MGIVNRTLDDSQQQFQMSKSVNDTTTGADYYVGGIPHPATIQSAKCVAVGLSGTPTVTLQLERFVEGAGLTEIAVTSALTNVAVGTSGPQSFTLGSSFLELQAGDRLKAVTGGANAALTHLEVDVVLKATQDIKSWY